MNIANLKAMAMSEDDLQEAVLAHADMMGWLAFHDNDSRRNRAGLPDLLLVRERVIFAELKRQKGKYRDAQRTWMEALARAGVEVYLWRPTDWLDGSIEKVLTRRNGSLAINELQAVLERCELA